MTNQMMWPNFFQQARMVVNFMWTFEDFGLEALPCELCVVERRELFRKILNTR